MNGVSTATLAAALGVSTQGASARAARERWAYRDTPAGRLWDIAYLPQEIQVKVMRTVDASERGASFEAFKMASEKGRDKGTFRMALISAFRSSGMRVEDFVRAYNSGAAHPALLERLGAVSVPTFYRWLKAYRQEGINGLVARWGSAQRGGSLSKMEKEYLEHWYLSPEQRSAAHCWNLLRRALPDSTASYAACLRYLKSLPQPLQDFHRLGRTKFDALHQPYVDRDPALVAAMEQVVSDHHCFDFVVTRDGKVFRPWITTFQDYRSAKILGWCPSVYPSSLSIAVALYRMVSEYGAPELIHIDNGKDYRSKVLNGRTGKVKVYSDEGLEEDMEIRIQGAFGMIGADVTFSKPYHGQSKGRMERTFGSFAEYFAKDTGCYVGSNTVTRPEDAALFYRAINKKAKRLDVFPWEDFVGGFESFVRWWNAEWRGAGKGLNGMTPDEAFRSATAAVRPVDKDALLIALSKAEIRRVRENGVRLGGVDYWAPELFEWSGRDVVVRLPIANPDKVLVSDPKGRVICTAIADVFAETGDLAIDCETVGAARKANLEALDRYGVGKKLPPRGTQSIIDVASRAFPLEESPVSLPAAVGAENTPIRANKYKSPFDF